jgi:hypothetical protein
MTRLRCLDCQDGRDCRHSGYVPTGTILAARLFSRALVEAAAVIIMATIMASRPPTKVIGDHGGDGPAAWESGRRPFCPDDIGWVDRHGQSVARTL